MNIWLFRAGANGEYEEKFLKDKRVYLTWDNLKINLEDYVDREKLFQKLTDIYQIEKKAKCTNWVSQIYPIAHRFEKGDWVILPSKLSSTIHIGKIIGEYEYDETLENPYYHYRDVEWFAKDIPRNNFDQDILYSLGAFMTVCRIHRNNAVQRIVDMSKNGWKVPIVTGIAKPDIDTGEDETSEIDLESAAMDSITKYIIQKYKGHGLERLVDAILRAKGYTTFHSAKGADGGVDILASNGNLGFGGEKICVQVKSQDTPVDRPTLDQLGGVMNNFGADYGLLVSWSGFNTNVIKEKSKQFFKIRLWDANDILQNFFENYDRIDEEIKAEIPLKRVWMLSLGDMDN